MGYSASAALAFGVTLNLYDEDNVPEAAREFFEDEGDDLQSYLADRQGLRYPTVHADYDEYYARLKEIGEQCPLELINWGYFDYDEGERVLALKRTVLWENWGGPVDLPEAPSKEEIEQANEFCREQLGFGGSFDEGRWFLLASYG